MLHDLTGRREWVIGNGRAAPLFLFVDDNFCLPVSASTNQKFSRSSDGAS
jgi:hypothetical protein